MAGEGKVCSEFTHSISCHSVHLPVPVLLPERTPAAAVPLVSRTPGFQSSCLLCLVAAASLLKGSSPTNSVSQHTRA